QAFEEPPGLESPVVADQDRPPGRRMAFEEEPQTLGVPPLLCQTLLTLSCPFHGTAERILIVFRSSGVRKPHACPPRGLETQPGDDLPASPPPRLRLEKFLEIGPGESLRRALFDLHFAPPYQRQCTGACAISIQEISKSRNHARLIRPRENRLFR